ncbi:hypothetical protein V6N12_023380 [Hibiscus sabdariffa]|uniref:RNase H type-1 domain-containing protein n=1 Tax=Hibiscus sabdariffa TaxID=183260 RepID=A0ABR2FXI6_9ROSI
MDHIFRCCPVAYSIWETLIRADKKEEFYSMDFKRWIFVNLSNVGGFGRDQVHWDILFGSLLWCLWKKRNEWIFGDPDRYNESVLQRGLRLQKESVAACSSNAAEQLQGTVHATVHCIIYYIAELLDRAWSIKLCHIGRNGNCVADWMVKHVEFDDFFHKATL